MTGHGYHQERLIAAWSQLSVYVVSGFLSVLSQIDTLNEDYPRVGNQFGTDKMKYFFTQ